MRLLALVLTLTAMTPLIVGDRQHSAAATAENLPTPPGSRNMGLDTANHRVFIVAAKFGPAPAGKQGKGRGPVLPGSFTLMTIERDRAAR